MKNIFRSIIWAALLPVAARAQQSASADAIRVYLDCSYFCVDSFIHTEINYVNWVRDQADAQVHVIVSRLSTGGGGNQYTFTFTGKKMFAGQEDTLVYTARLTDSEDVIRRGITQTLKVGLVHFIAATPDAARLQISFAAPTIAKDTMTKKVHDPWNYWVFSLGIRSFIQGEESQKFGNYNGNVSASRTTDNYKMEFDVSSSYRESDFTYPGSTGADTTTRAISKSYNMSALLVKSYGPHWSAGARASANSSTFGNVSLGTRAGPAIEYSVWPYSTATRRSLVFRYSAGFRSADYREITIYDKTAETHPVHELDAELNLTQKFGSISVSTQFSQYLHNTSFYNASIFSNANVKLFKGFSIDFFGQYEKVHDQLFLPKGELTQEEILLQQHQRATGFTYFGQIGIRYSFGSIFNNVVNPRFGRFD